MQFYAFYRITGRPDLSDTSGLSADWAEVLSEPVVYKHAEGGKTTWGPSDHTLLIKLLYIIERKRDLGGEMREDSAEDKRGRAFLNSAPITPEFFDKWWHIDRFEIDDEVSQLEDVPAELAAQVPATGNAGVDDFFARRARGKSR